MSESPLKEENIEAAKISVEEKDLRKNKNIKGEQKNLRYASMNNPTIEAIISGSFRLPTEEMAKDKLAKLWDFFIMSRNQPDNSSLSSILWIRGYNITEDETKKGFLGNFAIINVGKIDDKFSLNALKLESELKFHPQRKRPKSRHPNWGHPILRAVKKRKLYKTVEAAQTELQLLHEEYPEVTIPCTSKLYVIIYSRTYKGGYPVKKFVLEIKVDKESSDGGFYIDSYENEYKPPLEKPETAKSEGVPSGYFTSMVDLKRKRKPAAKKATLADLAKKDDNAGDSNDTSNTDDVSDEKKE